MTVASMNSPGGFNSYSIVCSICPGDWTKLTVRTAEMQIMKRQHEPAWRSLVKKL